MELILNCLRDGRREDWTYDNVLNKLFGPDGNQVAFSGTDAPEPLLQCGEADAQDKIAPNKSRDMWNLRIQLGLKCNMHCRYCSQSKNRDDALTSPRQVPDFIGKLRASGIRVRGVIELWGGEPFVYWKTIKALVPELRKLYPDTAIAMVTNGTLLDEEKLDFCERYGIRLTFSHDGQGYRLRGDDPLDDPAKAALWRSAFSRLQCSVLSVLSPANTDIEGIAEHIRSRLGDVPVHFEGVMTHNGVQDPELMFTDAQLLELQKSVFRALDGTDCGRFPTLLEKAGFLARMLAGQRRLSENAVICDMNKEDNAAVNLRGHFLSCHDYGAEKDFVGRLEELENVDVSKRLKPWSKREKCRKCLVLTLCRGACPQVEGLARSMTCRNDFAYFFAIFQAVFWSMFGLTIESYSPKETTNKIF